MHASDIDNALWLASDTAQVFLLLIFIMRRIFREFPVAAVYVSWQLISDLLLFLTLHAARTSIGQHYLSIYFSLNIVTYLLELGLLLEIGAHVLRPAKRALPRITLYFLLGTILSIGAVYFLMIEWRKPSQFANIRIFLVMD